MFMISPSTKIIQVLYLINSLAILMSRVYSNLTLTLSTLLKVVMFTNRYS